jgi:D-3-phosphoglycerate dehydrogenase
MVHKLACYSLISKHDVTRYREPARNFDQLVERLRDADVVVAVRERVNFSRALLERLPRLKLLALVGRNAGTIDFAACTALGSPCPPARAIRRTRRRNSPLR